MDNSCKVPQLGLKQGRHVGYGKNSLNSLPTGAPVRDLVDCDAQPKRARLGRGKTVCTSYQFYQ
jgi:hypothetical protein